MQRHFQGHRDANHENLQSVGVRNLLKDLLNHKVYEKSSRTLASAVIELMEIDKVFKLDWKIRHFWVVKKAEGHQKGDIVFRKEHDKLLSLGNAKFRDIYCHPERTRKALRGISRAIEEFNKIPTQYGFKTGIGVHHAFATMKQEGEYRFYVDLENAFCQITRRQIYFLFHTALGLSKMKANWLADRMVDESGHLFQGNPLAPQIFNLLSSVMNKVLAKYIQKHEITTIQYADDLTFVSHKPIPLSMRKWIIRLIKLTGWKANMDKTNYKKPNSHIQEALGFRETKNQGIQAIGQRRMRKLMRYLWHIKRKYKDFRLTPRGNSPLALIKGFEAWLTLVNRLRSPSSRTLYYNIVSPQWQIYVNNQLSLW